MEYEKIIEALIFWNFWERDISVGVPRNQYLQQISRYLKTDEIVALTGVRRSGKSTILLQTVKQLIHQQKVLPQNTLYINFEDPKFFNYLKIELLDEIYKAYKQYLKPQGRIYIVLDEVQKIEGWEHWVRTKYDQKEDVKIFVTGSNADFLASEFSNVLTGRHFQIQVTPLNFREFLEFKKVEISNDPMWFIQKEEILNQCLAEYLIYGGFPKVVLAEDEFLRKELLMQYFHDILSKDIVDRYKLKEITKLKSLALFYAANITRKFSFHKVDKVIDFPISLDSIQKFSHYLQSSFLVNFLVRFSYSLKNQMQTDRKVYFIDNGMRNAVAFKFSSDKGKLLENAVYQHLLQQKKEVYYFNEKKEVDFVCMESAKIKELIGVCYSLKEKETFLREVAALKEGMAYFKRKKALLITADGDEKEIKEDGAVIKIASFKKWALS